MLEARYLSGQSVADVAIDLRVSIKAAESRLVRARTRFRQTLGLLVAEDTP